MSFDSHNIHIDSLNNFLYNHNNSTLMSIKNWNRNIAMAVYNKFREELNSLTENEFISLLNLYITDARGKARPPFTRLDIQVGDNDYVIVEKAYNILKDIYNSLMDRAIYKNALQEPFDQGDEYAEQYKQTKENLRNTPTSEIEKMLEDELVRPDLEELNVRRSVPDFDIVMKSQPNFNLPPFRGGKKKYKKYRKSRRKSKRKYRKSKRLNKNKKSKSKK